MINIKKCLLPMILLSLTITNLNVMAKSEKPIVVVVAEGSQKSGKFKQILKSKKFWGVLAGITCLTVGGGCSWMLMRQYREKENKITQVSNDLKEFMMERQKGSKHKFGYTIYSTTGGKFSDKSEYGNQWELVRTEIYLDFGGDIYEDTRSNFYIQIISYSDEANQEVPRELFHHFWKIYGGEFNMALRSYHLGKRISLINVEKGHDFKY